MPKTLVIHSDRAYDLAHARARAEGKTVEAVIEEALGGAPTPMTKPDVGSPDDYAAFKAALFADLDRLRATLPPGVTSDHSDFYDENGLPK